MNILSIIINDQFLKAMNYFINHLNRIVLFFIFSILLACSENHQHDEHEKPMETVSIIGAGASFPAIVYTSWSAAYHQETKKQINYQSIGSSAGVKQLNSKTVDFAASDIPLSDEVLKEKDYFQFPSVIGGIVMIINIDGIKTNELILNGETVANIYMGKIKKWNDPDIQKLNPHLKLPDQPIIVVHRSDSSGTTFIFTKYLSQVSQDWQKEMGNAATISWKTGIGDKGNDGVSTSVKTLKNSIGYVEFSYAEQNKLAFTKLINQSGNVVSPNAESFSLATSGRDWDSSLAQDLTNGSEPNAWPIVSTTYIVLPKHPKNTKSLQEILKFFDWGYGNKGKSIVNSLNYVPLPEKLISLIRQKWEAEFQNIK